MNLRRLNGLAACVVAGVAGSVALVATRADSLALVNAALAIAIIWVGLAPGFLYLRQPAEARYAFPLMPLTGLFYAVFFGMPAFLADYLIDPNGYGGIEFYQYSFVDSVSTEGQGLLLAGMIGMFLTWEVCRRWAFRWLPRFSVPGSRDDRAVVILAWGLAIAHIAYQVVPAVRALPSVGQFIQPAGFVAFAVFYLLLARRRLSRGQTIAYFLLVLPVWVGHLLASGYVSSLFLLLAFWLALRYAESNILPWKFIVATPLLLLIAYPNLQEFRSIYWRSKADTSPLEKVTGLAEIIYRQVRDHGLGSAMGDRTYGGIVRRVSLLLPYSHVVESTPEKVPYWDGRTYQTLLIGWVPRFVMPDKPEERWGNEFGRRYSILRPDQRLMSINIPWVTEMYANFGRIGVLLGMTAVGLFLGFLDRLLNSPSRRLLEFSVGSAILLPLFNQESNFTLMTGSLLPLCISMWLYFFFGLRFLGAVRARLKA